MARANESHAGKWRGGFSWSDDEKTAVAHHVTSHTLHAREIFHCEHRQEVSTRMCYNDRCAGARRATFSHFLTRQLHHILSSYCTYVRQHSRSLSPRAEPYDNVAWCHHVWYPRIFQQTSHSSHFSGRCRSKIPAGSLNMKRFFNSFFLTASAALGEFIDCDQEQWSHGLVMSVISSRAWRHLGGKCASLRGLGAFWIDALLWNRNDTTWRNDRNKPF